MLLKQVVKDIGVEVESHYISTRRIFDINFINSDLYQIFNISFINSDGDNDETQFEAQNIDELDALYTEFCKENGFKTDTVYGITIVAPD
ncbi:MAG: hypothetical protein K0R00_10 [Herbinix sp.]|jgi:hypothetical protein|nr:hypothetical protein [Herbinix sp.]